MMEKNKIQCLECGNFYTEKKGRYAVDDDPQVGYFTIHSAEWLKCEQCGDEMLPAKLANQIDKARAERVKELLKQIPVAEYITSKEATEYIDMSRQALNKRKRNGSIYSIQLDEKTILYLAESVRRFKKNGDGRFFLLAYTNRFTPALESITKDAAIELQLSTNNKVAYL